jgi:hypothetical protein
MRMTALPLEILRSQRPENLADLLSGPFDKRQFLSHVLLVVGQASSEQPRITLEQFRLLEGDDPLLRRTIPHHTLSCSDSEHGMAKKS